jgi:hypothetical protein
MKKVKIMLSAIVVLTVVGGALAFKAKTDEFCLYQIEGTTCPSINILESYNGTLSNGNQTVRDISDCPTQVPKSECTVTVLNTVVD